MPDSNMTSDQVKDIAKLANIPITSSEADNLAGGFDEVLDFVSNLKELDTSTTATTHQVTGLDNVLRNDVVRTETMFTQTEALSNGSKTYKGYFVVPRIIDND